MLKSVTKNPYLKQNIATKAEWLSLLFAYVPQKFEILRDARTNFDLLLRPFIHVNIGSLGSTGVTVLNFRQLQST